MLVVRAKRLTPYTVLIADALALTHRPFKIRVTSSRLESLPESILSWSRSWNCIFCSLCPSCCWRLLSQHFLIAHRTKALVRKGRKILKGAESSEPTEISINFPFIMTTMCWSPESNMWWSLIADCPLHSVVPPLG